MPALSATFTANADPMLKQFQIVRAASAQTGKAIRENIQGGSVHAGQSGVIRETLVLMREMSRGNWTRVPGSLSILLGRLGVLKVLLGDTAKAEQVLAGAWAKQAEQAGIAALAARRKAQASIQAFYADAEETEATLEQAIADERGAQAAEENAIATREKALAAQETAASVEGAGAISVGVLGMIGGAILGLAIGAGIAFKEVKAVENALGGLGVKDFRPDYIAKTLQAINRAGQEQKSINDEIEKTVKLYHSAAQAAERVSEATKNHFAHLRRMNEFEKDPAKKAQRELEIDQQERNAELANKSVEKTNLEIEAATRQRQAQAINVTSKEQDENLLRMKRAAAEDAQKYLDSKEGRGFWGTVAGLNPFSGAGGLKGIDAGLAEKRKEAQQRITDYHNAVDTVAGNDELRKKRDELIKQSGSSAADAAKIGEAFSDLQKQARQANKDEAEEMAARLASEHARATHGHVNELQRVGAYASPAVMSVHTQQLHTQREIKALVSKIASGRSGWNGARF